MRLFSILLILSCVAVTGCLDRPERGAAAYGTVVDALPSIEEAKEPFPFPYAGENDHRDCVFNDEDFF